LPRLWLDSNRCVTSYSFSQNGADRRSAVSMVGRDRSVGL